jgi:hypothetical protein
LMTEPGTSPQPAPSRTSRRWWAVPVVLLVLALSLVTVSVTGPRVSVRWQPAVTPIDRRALEERHDLRHGRIDDPQQPLVWRYELGDTSRDAVAALVRDPAVADTNYIDRSTFEVDDSTVTVGSRLPTLLAALPFPFSTDNRFDSLSLLFHVQSLVLIAAGVVLLRTSGLGDVRRRRHLTIAVLLAVGIAAIVVPIRPGLLRMADSNMYTKNRSNFEATIGRGEVPFENHLTIALLGRMYSKFGPGEDAPERTFQAMTRLASVWFVCCALAIGFVERWSAHVVRYLSLALLAPSTLLFFGHRDFAYLSLNVATFPLLAHGIVEGSKRLEAGSALAGLGTAFHGFGLLSIVGAWLGTLVTRASIGERLARIARIAAWATAAWVGWVAIYTIVFGLGVAVSHASSGSWRPLFVDIVDKRLTAAILSPAGVRDILVSGWVVGVPLFAVAASLWTRHRSQVIFALFFAAPSALYWIFFWPVQGLAVDTGHVVGAFPAFFALAWLCAHQPRQTAIAAAILVTSHIGFWRMVLDTRFVNWTLRP